jgi:hypothetical protein
MQTHTHLLCMFADAYKHAEELTRLAFAMVLTSSSIHWDLHVSVLTRTWTSGQLLRL